MERRLGRVLDMQLVEAYLKLDEDQLTSKKVGNTFSKVFLPSWNSLTIGERICEQEPSATHRTMDRSYSIYHHHCHLDFYVDKAHVCKRKAAPSRQWCQDGCQPLPACPSLLCLPPKIDLIGVAEATRFRVQNKAWHRLNLMKGFSLNEKLRRDISVTGIESWLVSEMDVANAELGDIPTRPPWHGRAASAVSFARHIISNCVESIEYLWLIYLGLKKGITLGTLQLIRSSAQEVLEQLWSLSYTADHATEEWKNLVAFYKILEVKSDIQIPENPVQYVSSPAGMKIEAKEIRYKYDLKSEEEVLKGTSFVINPGEMIAVVGYLSASERI